MKLDDKYFIETDVNNVVLKYEKVFYDEAKGKDVTRRNEWYCRDFSHALNIYMNESLKPCEDIIELRKELNRIEELIKDLRWKSL